MIRQKRRRSTTWIARSNKITSAQRLHNLRRCFSEDNSDRNIKKHQPTMSRAVTRAHGRAQQQEQRQAAAIAGFAAEFHGAEHYQQQQQPEAGGTQDDESSTTPSTAGHHDSSSPAAVANNNNNNINNGTAAPPAAAAAAAAANNRTNRVPSNRLLRIRQHFNATGVRRKARSESTFDGHQRNNKRFL